MFYFRLQSILDYRKQIEEKQALELANIKNRLDREQKTLNKVQKERATLTAKLENIGKSSLCAANVSVYFSYIHRMKKQENDQKEVIGKVEKELEAQRQAFVNASQKRKILATVKEKKLAEYKLELIRREQKELDEAGILRAGKGVKIEETDSCL